MGLTTQYHKYVAGGIFSLVASTKCNVAWLQYGSTNGKFCAIGACENVLVWDVKTKTLVSVHGNYYLHFLFADIPLSAYISIV